MPLAFMTTRTLSSLEYTFNEIDVTYPMVVMNGAAVYHFETKTYDEVYEISYDSRKTIDLVLENNNVQAFKYSINDNCLHCYHDKLINEGEINYYTLRLKKGNDDFVRAKLPDDIHASLYVIIEKKEKVQKLIEEISKNTDMNQIDLIDYPYNEGVDGYWYLKINSKKANKGSVINRLKKEYGFKKVIVCGSGKTDLNVIKNADFSICLSSAQDYIKNNVSLVVDDNPETVLRIFDKLYHCLNVEKSLKKITKKYMR